MNNSFTPPYIHIHTWMLGLYFVCMAFDSFSLGRIGSVLKIVAVLPLVAVMLNYKKLTLRFCAQTILPILFVICSMISLLYSLDIGVTIKYCMSLSLNIGVIIILGSMIAYNDSEVLLLKHSLLCGGWLTAVLTLIFSDFSAFGRLTLKLGQMVQDQNGINGYFMVPIAWHLNALICDKKKAHVFPLIILLTICMATGSRGGIVAFICMFMIFFIKSWVDDCDFIKKVIRFLEVGLILILALALSFSLLPDTVTQRFTVTYFKSKGMTGRNTIWSTLWNHFITDPLWRQLLGHGYGTTRFVNTYKNYVAHNLYLDNLISVGIVGMLIHIFMQLTYLVSLIKAKETILAIAFIGFMILCCTLSLVSFKPIWNLMLLTLIIVFNQNSKKVR